MCTTNRLMTVMVLSGAVTSVALAQDQAAPARGADCHACHSCTHPTLEQPCLRPCERGAASTITDKLRYHRGPDVVILDELEDRYLPVPFDHKGHAEMAGMTQGCTVCHHYTPEGWQHPACKTCHDVAPAREDIRRPGLKGAYHRQCLNCHREWSHETNCSICHAPKTGQREGAEPPHVPTRDDIIGLMHPPIPEPETLAYESKFASTSATGGSTIIFRHKQHIHSFGLQCVECHHESNCNRCHGNQSDREAAAAKTPKEHHRPCTRCHDTEEQAECGYCHVAPGEATPVPTHQRPGLKLSRFHEQVACRRCHVSVPFTRPPTACQACHKDWTLASFDHRVTGQTLDEHHARTDCAECHLDRRFDRPPVCEECHEEEEGIAFPDRRPGPYLLSQTP